MTPANLLLKLKSRFENELTNFTLQSENETKGIGIHLHLANENFTHEDLYPLIILNLLKVEDLELQASRPSMSIATIEFTIGVFGEDTETFLDLLNICEFIRQSLLRDSLIDSRHRLELPIQTEIAPDQPYPFQFAWIRTQFSIGRKF